MGSLDLDINSDFYVQSFDRYRHSRLLFLLHDDNCSDVWVFECTSFLIYPNLSITSFDNFRQFLPNCGFISFRGNGDIALTECTFDDARKTTDDEMIKRRFSRRLEKLEIGGRLESLSPESEPVLWGAILISFVNVAQLRYPWCSWI